MFGGGGGGGSDGEWADGGGSPTGQPSCVKPVWQNIWFFQWSGSILETNMGPPPPASRLQSTLSIRGLSDCERGFTPPPLAAFEMVEAPPAAPFVWLTADSDVRISPPLDALPMPSLLAAAWASRMHWRRRKTTTTMPAMQSNKTTPLRIPSVGVSIELLGRGSAKKDGRGQTKNTSNTRSETDLRICHQIQFQFYIYL